MPRPSSPATSPHRLPLSNRRDELDMLAAIVNAMLDRIEKLMNEVKGVCDNIAHDLRTPLTRLRAQLYRIRQEADQGCGYALKLDDAIAETDTLMARFRGLLRISELEDHQRRSGFLVMDPLPLLRELHDFYLPLAEEGELQLRLETPESLPWITGDRAPAVRSPVQPAEQLDQVQPGGRYGDFARGQRCRQHPHRSARFRAGHTGSGTRGGVPTVLPRG